MPLFLVSLIALARDPLAPLASRRALKAGWRRADDEHEEEEEDEDDGEEEKL